MAGFGDKVVEYRTRLGLSQHELAQQAGIDPSYLNKVERGKRNAPGVSKVLALVDALRLTRDEATELVQLAAYSPLVLQSGSGLAHPSPTIHVPPPVHPGMHANLDGLQAAVAKLPRADQQACVDALVTLVETLVALAHGHAGGGQYGDQ